MHSINCLFDHGRRQEPEQQQQQKIVGPLKHQLADSFPIFQLTPRWELALRCVIEIRPSSKSVWVHSSIHSLSHTHALILWHTRQRRGADICSCCCCVGNSNYDNLKCISVSSRKCCILFNAYRQTTFSPTISACLFSALTFHTCRFACEKLLGSVFV